MSRDSKLIGVCGVRINEQNVMPFMKVLQKKSKKNGYKLVIFSGSTDTYVDTDEVAGQNQFVELIRKVDICALVMLTETVRNESTIQKILKIGEEKNIPIFSLDRHIDGYYSMTMDNSGCFEDIVRHVVEEHGARRINMIAGIKGNPFSEERINIYRKVLTENNIPVEEERIGHGDFWQCPASRVMERFIKSDTPFPDAIVCANDLMAHAAVATLNEYGYDVPEDVIVTGYDGTKNGESYFPSITTGAPDYAMMIDWVYDRINDYIENGNIEEADIVVPVLFKRRQSCGCQEKIMEKSDRRFANVFDEIGTEKRHMEGMQAMVSSSFGKRRFDDLIPIIRESQRYMDAWFDFYRYVGIKDELFESFEVPDEFSQMITLFEGDDGKFRETLNKMDVMSFQAYIDRVFDKEKANVVLVHPLISGKDVYGFNVEGFDSVTDWKIKQADEFAMFLSHVLHSVLHEHRMFDLNNNLAKANEEIQKMSLCDPMTGIYNRRGFFKKTFEIIHNSENTGKYLYLFMIDMDGLKYINDNFGHTEGDFVITALGHALAKMQGGESVCARIGGDEFICAYVKDEMQDYSAECFNEHMQEIVNETEGMKEKEYPVGASVGMMCEKITEELDLDSMINNADDKMYKHKMARKRCRL